MYVCIFYNIYIVCLFHLLAVMLLILDLSQHFKRNNDLLPSSITVLLQKHIRPKPPVCYPKCWCIKLFALGSGWYFLGWVGVSRPSDLSVAMFQFRSMQQCVGSCMMDAVHHPVHVKLERDQTSRGYRKHYKTRILQPTMISPFSQSSPLETTNLSDIEDIFPINSLAMQQEPTDWRDPPYRPGLAYFSGHMFLGIYPQQMAWNMLHCRTSMTWATPRDAPPPPLMPVVRASSQVPRDKIWPKNWEYGEGWDAYVDGTMFSIYI